MLYVDEKKWIVLYYPVIVVTFLQYVYNAVHIQNRPFSNQIQNFIREIVIQL